MVMNKFYFLRERVWVVDLSEGNEGRRDCSEIYYSGRTGTVLAAWLLHRDPALSAIDAMSRVREGFLLEYARGALPRASLSRCFGAVRSRTPRSIGIAV